MAAVTEVKRLNKIKFVSEEQVQGFLWTNWGIKDWAQQQLA